MPKSCNSANQGSRELPCGHTDKGGAAIFKNQFAPTSPKQSTTPGKQDEAPSRDMGHPEVTAKIQGRVDRVIDELNRRDSFIRPEEYVKQGSKLGMSALPIDLGEYIRTLIDARLRRFPNETRKCRTLQIVRKDKVRIDVEVPEDMVLVDRMLRHVKWMEG